MNGKRLSVGISLCFTLTGACFAAGPITQGTIEFHGSIVEPSCIWHAIENSKFELNGCRAVNRTKMVNAIRVEPINIGSSPDRSNVNVKLLAGGGRDSRYRDQQYELVDAVGTPVLSGKYLITQTMP
ncbi:MAG: type 1 fimbrial protein [Gammaproteobacteria bacterium]|nr:type 1 fimbrial protein [Gammaproteobacteria bacterium]MBU0817467.1 type 1 fimbrial protein [Gammaproteobacteria bacterium]MBU0845121.1 type 1 fimbrial protein [Gammaproteobacteria bacterium]MBU1839858.1 type 1 fimbrial protein [Gammaproteobacteria bacterium]